MQPVVQPVWQPVGQPAVSCKRGLTVRLSVSVLLSSGFLPIGLPACQTPVFRLFVGRFGSKFVDLECRLQVSSTTSRQISPNRYYRGGAWAPKNETFTEFRSISASQERNPCATFRHFQGLLAVRPRIKFGDSKGSGVMVLKFPDAFCSKFSAPPSGETVRRIPKRFRR